MTELWNALADPWSGEIMRRAFAEVILVGTCAGAIGCWIVLNELSYGAESLPHAMLPGLVLAGLAGLPLLLGGALGLLVAALAIAAAARTPRIGGDSAIAVVVTGLLGLGVLIALSPDSPQAVQALLFGDILGVTDGDLFAAALLTIASLALLRLLHSRLLIVSFDRTTAGAVGVARGPADIALLLLLSLAVLVAVQALGNLLVVALLIAPAASARLLTRRMVPMMAMAAAIAVTAGVSGLYASYHLDTAAGASIAIVLVLVHLGITAVTRVTMTRTCPSPA
jgi:ABC-type Mn2+/Zn2+ transport system permease subunit